ncbi:MAG: V-type ATP synthase subunit E [Candidatus Bathyarchaeota archaeon]|nr:V-type ATP synthase subunit E [Candidatus Bathyarchaeota archaeon]
MSEEQMENTLIDKTVQQHNEIIEKAKERAAKITANTDAEKKRIEAQTNNAIENIIGGELRAVHDRIVGGAQLQGRKQVMEARTEVVNKVFKLVEEEIKNIVEGPDYKTILVKLTKESIENLAEDCIVYANKEDAATLKSMMEELPTGHKVKIEESPVDIVGGVTVVNLEGTKTVHNTLDSRLAEAKGKLTASVAEKLGVI